MRRQLRSIIALVCGLLLVLILVAPAGARTFQQPVISVSVTADGVVENGLSFFVYDGGPFSYVTVDGVKAVRLDERASSNRYLYLDAHNDVMFDGPFDAEVTFTVMAKQPGRFRLLYDSVATGERYESSGYATIGPEDVGKWVTRTFKLPNMRFGQRAASGQADMRLNAVDRLELFVRAVEIKATPL